ncbi:CLUMA_CG010215, isoform A [Clunio marinus]|uniref:CLUMA_CG010215, isoform A n=1 Tax=Clunio marinus TaxID=568069 RepID=A0A1J1IAU0_9DIPT|nr:CLUMA_CG010215, isoform A [Clunio marinus]
MEEFQIELNSMDDLKSPNHESNKVLIEFARYYQNIVDIMEQFNKSFGMHLTKKDLNWPMIMSLTLTLIFVLINWWNMSAIGERIISKKNEIFSSLMEMHSFKKV